MIKLKQIYVLIFAFSVYSCGNKNDSLFSDFKSNFNDSIQKYNAEEFDFNYDNLLPQKSYFINGKLKYLVLKSSGELCNSEKMYTFDLKSDSLIQKIERSECYETSDRLKKTNDIIFLRTKESTEQFYDNGMVLKTENADSDFIRNEIIKKIKTDTEKAYKNK
ncbi:hypothetical protein [Chryseobacterium sp.]|uniref:hypothetical protein n=1 Tax=Chryseobacterium sp. TaxID=1871047 RepID=UPI0028A29565|nr:hypothetical protein [Chryseobacterium sp.]